MSPSSKKLTTHKPAIQNDKQKIQQSRSVHFSLATKVRLVPKVNEDEIQALWLTESDYTNIQLGILKTVKRMRQGKLNLEKYCVRGLEHMATSSHMEQRKKDKETLRDNVLSEQSKQRQSGIHDPMSIRLVSLAASRKSRESALRVGASDATVAHHEERNHKEEEENKSYLDQSQSRQAICKNIKADSSQDVNNVSCPQSRADILRRFGIQLLKHLQPEAERDGTSQIGGPC